PSSIFIPITGPSDNGVTQLEFSNTTYAGSATLNPLGGGFYTVASGSATINGTQIPTGAGSSGPFSVLNAVVGGSCQGTGASVASGLTFGALNDFNFPVNGQTRWFTHTMNLTAVPEPATALLFAGGMAGLGLLGRRRGNRS